MIALLYRLSDRLRHRARRHRWEADLALGRRGEDMAHRYLQRQGLTVVARNWRTPGGDGEIDIVAWDCSTENATLVFIEVKSRQSDEFGSPDRAIGAEKVRNLRRAARAYATRAGVPWEEARLDVVNVIFGPPLHIQHWRDAFLPQSGA